MHADDMPGFIERWRRADRPLERSLSAWRSGCRRFTSAGGYVRLQRELQRDAYMMRSGTTYEDACGHHIISQGETLQYDNGLRADYRDPLQQHMLPMIYTEPELHGTTI